MMARPRKRRDGVEKHPIARPLAIELLEERIVLSLPACEAPTCQQVELFAEFDLFGEQIGVVQVYQDADTVIVDELDENGVLLPPHIHPNDLETRVTFGIFDTGASVVSFSANDQFLFTFFGNPIDIKVAGGASADAVGGVLTGDVSQPGALLFDGLHAWELDAENILNSGINLDGAAAMPNIQAFVGTFGGSPVLPPLVGTPGLSPSIIHPQGLAAEIDMLGFELDIGALLPELPEFKDIVLFMPDIRFVDPNTPPTLPDDGSVTDPVRIPLTLWGEDNTADPGDFISVAPNPVQTQVTLAHGDALVTNRTMLFDTGAQLSIASTDLAVQLGVDLNNPVSSITVQGAAGTVTVPGFTIDALEVPRDDNSDGIVDGTLRFTNVPIFVLDIVDGLDGILGMNLFNGARSLLYDPYDAAGASLTLSFLADRLPPPVDDPSTAALDQLAAFFPAFANVVSGGFPTARLDGGGGWQNPFNRFDVDNSGDITTIDIFALINDIRTEGQRTVPEVAVPPDAPLPYADVNGDLNIDTIDLFDLIDHMRTSMSLGGEGEGDDPTVSLGAIGFRQFSSAVSIAPTAADTSAEQVVVVPQQPTTTLATHLAPQILFAWPAETSRREGLEHQPSYRAQPDEDPDNLPHVAVSSLWNSPQEHFQQPAASLPASSMFRHDRFEEALSEIAGDVALQWRALGTDALTQELFQPLGSRPTR